MLKSELLSLVFLLIVGLYCELSSSLGFYVKVPERVRTQGKISIDYLKNGQKVRHQLSYNEAIDSIAKRYKVSIGYVSYEPTVYFASEDHPAISQTDGRCETVEHPSSLIPELSWFLDLAAPKVDIKQALVKYPYIVGPFGLMLLFSGLDEETEYTRMKAKVYRNIMCENWERTFDLPEKNLRVKMVIYILMSSSTTPSWTGADINGGFTIMVSARPLDSRSSTEATEPEVYDYNLVIDLFEETTIDKSDKVQLERLNYEFTMPLSSGCSKFLPAIKLDFKLAPFSMSMRQLSMYQNLLFAYDPSQRLLRREILGKSVSIWDIREDLLYHIDTQLTSTISDAHVLRAVELQSCSVLKVDYESMSPAFKPYDSKSKEPLDALRMLGTSSLAYMGLGFSRDIPSYIFETIVEKPPAIFGSAAGHSGEVRTKDLDFLVQIHIVQGKRSAEESLKAPILKREQFIPLQIVLYKRQKSHDGSEGPFQFVDLIEVNDFHWSLYGWDVKPAGLFMASECYEESTGETVERKHVELALKFDSIHEGKVEQNDLEILDQNRFKLEQDLTDMITRHLGISKMHMIDYEVEFGAHHLDVSMTLADGRELKSLDFWGEGYIENKCDNVGDCIRLHGPSEEECISLGTMIVDLHLVAHCPAPRAHSPTFASEVAKCLAFRTNNSPQISNSPTYRDSDPCQIYIIHSRPKMSMITSSLSSNLRLLKTFTFQFHADIPTTSSGETTRPFSGKIEHYDIITEYKVLRVNKRVFLAHESSHQVRNFDAFTYSTQGDCEKMCNFDSDCKSYAYCSPETGANKCLVSSLDLRDSVVQHQLANQDKTIELVHKNEKYQLETSESCDIVERNYMSFFSDANEVFSIPIGLAIQSAASPTTFDCAKRAIDLESESIEHHSELFAYCAQTNTCLLDEDLVKKSQANKQVEGGKELAEDVLCEVFRRQHNSYFHVSSQVFKKIPDQQVELRFNTVEECARTCWLQLGATCASFDYCSPAGGCTINHMSSSAPSYKSQLEPKADCLHYERDMKWDELRLQHMIGRHQPMDQGTSGRHSTSGTSFSGFVLRVIFYVALSACFVVGLFGGGLLSDKLGIESGPPPEYLSRVQIPQILRIPLRSFSRQNGHKPMESTIDELVDGEHRTRHSGTNGYTEDFSGHIQMDVIRSHHMQE